jgi:hypothetical protein
MRSAWSCWMNLSREHNTRNRLVSPWPCSTNSLESTARLLCLSAMPFRSKLSRNWHNMRENLWTETANRYKDNQTSSIKTNKTNCSCPLSNSNRQRAQIRLITLCSISILLRNSWIYSKDSLFGRIRLDCSPETALVIDINLEYIFNQHFMESI